MRHLLAGMFKAQKKSRNTRVASNVRAPGCVTLAPKIGSPARRVAARLTVMRTAKT